MSITTIPSSRVGRKPVTIPTGVDVKKTDHSMTIKGRHGLQEITLHPYVTVSIDSNVIYVKPNAEAKDTISGPAGKLYRSIAGTVRANISNGIHGVSEGFVRKLTLHGVGYRAQVKGTLLSLSLGFSHPTDFEIPKDITIETPTQTEILIKGSDKERVGLVASQIRAIRPPELYKGKGVRYADEVIELKETKKK